jgi:hypothetical protein
VIRSELVEVLNRLPDIEVGTDDGTVTGASLSSYDTEELENIPFICLDVD